MIDIRLLQNLFIGEMCLPHSQLHWLWEKFVMPTPSIRSLGVYSRLNRSGCVSFVWSFEGPDGFFQEAGYMYMYMYMYFCCLSNIGCS